MSLLGLPRTGIALHQHVPGPGAKYYSIPQRDIPWADIGLNTPGNKLHVVRTGTPVRLQTILPFQAVQLEVRKYFGGTPLTIFRATPDWSEQHTLLSSVLQHFRYLLLSQPSINSRSFDPHHGAV